MWRPKLGPWSRAPSDLGLICSPNSSHVIRNSSRPGRGIFCGEGWRVLTKQTSVELDSIARREDVAVSIQNIREMAQGSQHLGGPRFPQEVDAAADKITNRAETESETDRQPYRTQGQVRDKNKLLSVRATIAEVK